RHPAAHRLGQLDFGRAWRSVRPTALGGIADRREDGRVRMPKNQSAPRTDVIDILASVDIGETGAVTARDEKRRPADCPERPYGSLHATAQHPLRPVEALA